MQEHNEDMAGPGKKVLVNPGKESDYGGCNSCPAGHSLFAQIP